MSGEADSFERAWTHVQPRLRRMLAARGVAPHLVDDVLQDTAVRLLRSRDRIDSGVPLWPLARTIAVNCLVDRYRGSSAVPVRDLPDRPAPHDTEERGLARARLSRVQAALAMLRPTDRSILLAEIGVSPRLGNTSATKMARARARCRLVQALDRVGTVFGGMHAGWRRLTIWGQSQPSSDLQPLVPTAAGTIAALSIAVFALTASGPEAGTGSPKRAPRVAGIVPVADSQRESVRSGPPKPLAESEAKDRSKPRPSATDENKPEEETTTVEAGPARAESWEGKGHRGVTVRTGNDTPNKKDDSCTSVTVYDGSQDGSEEPDDCE